MVCYSELAQISRDAWAACRAARSAAATASRAARSAAASRPAHARSAAAAASQAARSAAAAARLATDIRRHDFPEEEERLRRIRTGTMPTYEHVPGEDVREEDVESEEATWALYEQWCNRSEMARRFPIFQRTAHEVVSWNAAYEGWPEEHECLGKYADGINAEELAERKRELALLAGRSLRIYRSEQHVSQN